jgi:hypothetical protein
MFTSEFGKIYVLNVKKSRKLNIVLEKKWRETRRETGKLFPWETGKQGNSSFEN